MRRLTILRIKRAKESPTSTSVHISEIAFEVGYSDSDYFTNTFKKETSLSPKNYRISRNFSDTTAPDKFCGLQTGEAGSSVNSRSLPFMRVKSILL